MKLKDDPMVGDVDAVSRGISRSMAAAERAINAGNHTRARAREHVVRAAGGIAMRRNLLAAVLQNHFPYHRGHVPSRKEQMLKDRLVRLYDRNANMAMLVCELLYAIGT